MEADRKVRMVAAVCALLAGLSAAAPAKVVYVDDDAAGANDGSSWANAFVRLQSALAVAGAWDEIRVAQGLYKPDPASSVKRTSATRRGGSVEVDPTTVVSTSFRLADRVAIRGGFAGSGAEDPNARDFERYETILSGDLNGDDIAAWGPGHLMYESSRDDNSPYVVESTSRTVGSTTVLDGFTIQAAVQSGLHNVGSSAQIINCTFRQNSSLRFSGGAVRCEGGEPTFSNCVFEDNAAMIVGGAIHFTGARVTLADCRFLHNWAMSLGGAISSTYSDLVLTGCTFTENAGQQGDAIYHQQGSLTLTDCRFEGNMAGEQGGWRGEGNIDVDPLFAGPGHWADASDPDVAVEPSQPNATWIDGDCHLKSQAGRWDPTSESWVLDEVTSPCIDAGDPNAPVGDEPEPNGGRINLGAYGGTAEASKSF